MANPYVPSSRFDRFLPPVAGYERQHVIPKELWGHPAIRQLLRDDVRQIYDPGSAASNGQYLPRSMHHGSHPAYTAQILQNLDEILGQTWFQNLANQTSNDPAAARRQLAEAVRGVTDDARVRSSGILMDDVNPDGTTKPGGLGRYLMNGSDVGVTQSPHWNAAHAATLSGDDLANYRRETVATHNTALRTTPLTTVQNERAIVAKAMGGDTLVNSARDPGIRNVIDETRAEAARRGIPIDETFNPRHLPQEALEQVAERVDRDGAFSLVRWGLQNPKALGSAVLRRLLPKLIPGVNIVSTAIDIYDVAKLLYDHRAEIAQFGTDVYNFYGSVYRQITTDPAVPQGVTQTKLYTVMGPHGIDIQATPGLGRFASNDQILFVLYGQSGDDRVVTEVDRLESEGVLTWENLARDRWPPFLNEAYDRSMEIFDRLFWQPAAEGGMEYSDLTWMEPDGKISLNPEGLAAFRRAYNARPAAENGDIVITGRRASTLTSVQRETADGVATENTARLSVGDSARPLTDSAGPSFMDAEAPFDLEGDDAVIEISQRTIQGLSGPIIEEPKIRLFTKGKANEEISGAHIAQIFGSNLSRLFGIENPLAARVVSVTAGELARNLFQEVDDIFGDTSTIGFDDFDVDIRNAGVGAISSVITAELIAAIGIDGLAGEAANVVVGSVVGNIATKLAAGASTANALSGAINLSQIGNAFGSFVGSTLAAEVVNFETVGGQIGSAIGSALGGYALGALFAQKFGALGLAAGPLGAAVGAFLGFIVGGLIGSVFGGTPRSGADAVWDEQKGEFTVANAYSKKGGSKDAAVSVATAVATSLNGVLAATGGQLTNSGAVQSGNYGMRKSDFVYRPVSTRDKHAITRRFHGDNAPVQITNYGVWQALSDPDFQITGGDIYAKRALGGIIAIARETGQTDENFSLTGLFGDLTVAQDYAFYAANSQIMNGIFALFPDNAFSIGWAATAARGLELGLNRRAASDWAGGYGSWLDLLGDGQIGGASLSTDRVRQGYDQETGERWWEIVRADGGGSYVLDGVNSADITHIAGTEGADRVVLAHTDRPDGRFRVGGADVLASAAGFTVNGEAGSAGPLTVDVTAAIDAGGGDDEVHVGDMGNTAFGGAGNDHLFGGKLDDWLIGGEGDDRLYSGDGTIGGAPVGLGGDGNYLDGGAGNDHVYGREGSDWLEGGDGTDFLEGGDGDDILAGGGGLDTLRGGRGNDQYLVRLGDGSDRAEEGSQVVVGSQGLAPSSRVAWLAANPGKRNWLGDIADIAEAIDRRGNGETNVVAAVEAGWDDAIVFGEGITLSDVAIKRVESDLEIGLTDGTKMVVAGWFADPFKRIEWLKFADGEELRLADLDTFTVGGAGDDVLEGDEQRNFIHGGAGDDYIRLHANDDVGVGGSGSDALFGDEDDDLLVGGTGHDKVFGGIGHDRLSGDLGDDALVGEQGDDVLAGGRGDDTLSGGTGSNVFRFSRGDGRDRIIAPVAPSAPAASAGFAPAGDDADGAAVEQNFVNPQLIYDGIEQAMDVSLFGANYLQGGFAFTKSAVQGTTKYKVTQSVAPPPSGETTSDTVEFAVGINIQDIVFSLSGGDLVATVSSENSTAAGSDSITFEGWDGIAANHIAAFTFYQTGRLEVGGDKTVIRAGGDGVDILNGDHRGDWMTSGAGDDELDGAGGADILNGGGGNDRIDGGDGNDVLYGGAGQDRIAGGLGADVISGGAGTDTASYAQSSGGVTARLSGSATNDGEAQGDTYAGIENLTGGGGDDRLGGDELDNVLEGGAGADILSGLEGDDSYDWKRGHGNDVIADTAVEIIRADGSFNPFYKVDWSFATRNTNSNSASGPGQYVNPQVGSGGEPEIEYTWRATVTGADGAVVFDGGSWVTSDSEPPVQALLATTAWTNGYARTGNGQQVARAWSADETGGVDTLALGEGISLSDLEFAWSGDDLLITVDGSDDSIITLRDQRGPNAAKTRIETLQLHDGQAVNLASVMHGAGGQESDLVAGNEQAQAMSGGAGNDVLWGGGGGDSLSGGEGDDVFESGVDAERFFGGAEGVDSGDNDTVRYVRSGAGVTVDLALQTAQVSQGSASGDLLHGIENVTGSIFGDRLTGDSKANRLIGLAGDNILTGNDGDDVLTALGGADVLDGGEGEDALAGGDGNDTLRGGAGKDFLDGGDGNDTLQAGAGDDQLHGGDGGGTLDGGGGDDLIVGGIGDDTMLGGDGDDRFVIEAGSGTDTITDDLGKNAIVFGEGVDRSRLWFTKDGDQLRIGVIGSDQVVKVEGFFATPNIPANVELIEAGGYSLYLNGTRAQTLIQRMINAHPGVAPTAMDSAIGSDLDLYWSRGNSAPENLALETPGPITVVEGTSALSAGGSTPRFVATDPEGESITWSLLDDLDGRFGIDAQTGVLSVRDPAKLDYETATSHSLTIRATDAQGAFTDHSATVAVTDRVDVLAGDDGDNVLKGQSGQDLLLGHGGNDVLEGGPGADTLDGGDGTDIARYAGAAGSVWADLEAKTGRAEGAVDTLISIEGVEGSAYGDMLLGSSAADILRGGAGDDSLDGRAGADQMAGGAGSDVYFVDDLADAVTELPGEGADEVRTGLADYTLAAGVEKLTGLSTAAGQTLRDNGLDNIVTGTAAADAIYLRGGGSDTAFGGDGNDGFYMGGTLDSSDRIDGGANPAGKLDFMILQGNTNLVLTGEMLRGIEWLYPYTGSKAEFGDSGLNRYSYVLAAADSLVAAGATFIVDGATLLEGESLSFDGSAETDGIFQVYGGNGVDTLIGGAGGDMFTFDPGRFAAGDTVVGGAGFDTLRFYGGLTATFAANSFRGIDSMTLAAGRGTTLSNYNLTTADSNVAAGQTLVVDAGTLRATETVTFNGAAETDGAFAITGGAGNDVLTGGAGADTLAGGLGDDSLTGGAGADQMAGGAGNDVYFVVESAGDSITEHADEGTDEVRTALAAYTLSANVENLTFSGTGTFRGTGNASDNIIRGGSSNDYFYLRDGGNDTVYGDAGNDWIYVGKALSAGDVFDGGAGISDQLALQGNYLVTLTAQQLTNVEYLYVMSGTDTFGQDMSNSRYSYDVTTVDANVAAGARLNVDGWYLVAGENFTFNGSAETDGSFLIYGGRGADKLTGGAGNDILSFEEGRWQSGDKVAGGAGADTMKLKGGYTIAFAADSMSGIETLQLSVGTPLTSYLYALTMNDGNVAAGQTLKVDGSTLRATETLTFDGSAETDGSFQVLGGAAADSLVGGSGADSLTGGAGNDVIDGRAGADAMDGGAGDDLFFVDNGADAITERAAEGMDEVRTAIADYTLAANVEKLTATSTTAGQTLRANAGHNIVTGTAFNDWFYLGTGGDDTATGGAGTDVFLMGASFTSADRIDGGAGIDQIAFQGNYALSVGAAAAAGIESFAILSGSDVRFGDSGLNRYNYVLTTQDDLIGSGAQTTFNASGLLANESFTLNGSAETDGRFLIWAGLGTDSLTGGGGADTFNFAEDRWQAADKVVGGEGIDTVMLRGNHSITFAQTALSGVEILSLASGPSRNTTFAYNLTMHNGNVAAGQALTVDGSNLAGVDAFTFDGRAEKDGSFVIKGGASNDVLTGGEGNDTIDGGAGDDVLDGIAGSDKLTGGEGNDIIYGGAGIDTLEGGIGNDKLYAEGDDDTLDGGAGKDLMSGHTGSDVFIMTRSSEQDTVENYNPSGSDQDVLAFRGTHGSIVREDLWFERVNDQGVKDSAGLHLRISVIGSTATATVSRWFADANPNPYRIKLITTEMHFSTDVNVTEMVALMGDLAKPASAAEAQAHLSDPVYKDKWAGAWYINKAPVLTDITAKTVASGSTLPVTVHATDDITPATAITPDFLVVGGDGVIAGHSWGLANAAGERTLNIATIATKEGTAEVEVTVMDAGGRKISDRFTVTAIGVPDMPTIGNFAGAGTSGQAGGVPLELAISFPDKDGSEVQEIAIAGVPAGVTLSAGTRDSATGIWKLTLAATEGLKINAPAGWSQDLTLTVTAKATENGSSATATKTAVIVLNAPPTDATLSGSVDENATVGTAVGTVTGTDPDPGDKLSYKLLDSAGGRFALIGDALVVSDGALLNFEAATSHNITVEVKDPSGQTLNKVIAVPVNNVNEANSLPATYAMGVNENVAVGTTVGSVTATDVDSAATALGQQRYSFWNGSAPVSTSTDGRYTIDPVSGAIKTAVAMDFESMTAPVDYAVIARDNAGNAPYFQAQTTVTITVGDVNEKNSFPSPYAFSVAENLAAGSPVGTIKANDLDRPGTLNAQQRYFFWNGSAGVATSSDGRYAINEATGAITTLQGLDRETMNPTTYRVVAFDGGTPSFGAGGDVTITVSDVNERPNALALQSQTLHSETLAGESGHSGRTIASFGLSDPDGIVPSLAIVGGNPHGWFTTGGGDLRFNHADFSAHWLRSTLGSYGQDSGWYHDSDGDGLKEIRVATLTLAAVDAGGLQGDPFTYNVLIEDRNEAPAWSAGYTFGINENPASYAWVGTVTGSDVDGPAGELRYGFSDWSIYHDGNIGYVSRSPDGRFLINNQNGNVYLNGTQAMDYEAGQRSFSYATTIRDRAAGPHSLSQAGTLTINLQNVNEAHSLGAHAITVNENHSPSAYVPVATTAGVNDPAAVMLSDPEGGAMRWQFANGTTADGPWRIDASTGKIWQGDPVDYEALTRQTTYESHWNGYEEVTYPVTTFDPSRAVFNLAVQAVDDGIGYAATSNLQVTVADVNEPVTVTSAGIYRSGGGAVVMNTYTDYYVRSDRNNGSIVNIYANDPEGRGLTYSIGNQVTREINVTYGGADEIDGGYPVLTMDSYGTLGFTVYGDPDWEGGTKINSQRRTLSIEYSFDLYVTDSAGLTTTVPYKVTFLRRNSTVPPVVLDLDGDGIELVSYNGSTVKFDMDADGVKDSTGWVGADDGLLALDRDGDGMINQISEISFVGDVSGATSDLEGLKAYDSDGDGSLDAGDARYGEFRIWRDSNQDGVSQAGELRSLAEAGVSSINLDLVRTGQEPAGTDNVLYATTQWTDGTGVSHAVGDVFFAYDPSNLDTIAAPIVIDYDGDGSGLVSIRESEARFDMDGDGVADRTGWIARGDALLALDRNGDGIVNDVGEISFTGDKPGAQTDLEGLAGFDTNADGLFSALDERFGDFRLWFDRNGDGTSNRGELRTLEQAGIASISLGGEKLAGGGQSSGSNLIFAKGSFTRDDGSTGGLLDAGLAYLPGGGDSTVAFSGWDGGAAPAGPAAEPKAADHKNLRKDGTMMMEIPQVMEAQNAPAMTGEGEPEDSPAARSSAQAKADLAPQAAELAKRSFEGREGRYSMTASGGSLFVTGNKPEGAVDSRVQEVRPGSLLSFRNGTVGLVAPLVLDLDGDGVELTRRGKSKARFDMDGNGSRDDTGWISRQDGFLVVDLDGDGRITSPAELSLLGLKPDAKSGLDALAALDSDKNGSIDSKDSRFGELKIWVDANGNGVTEAGELQSLADRGIASVGLAARAAADTTVKIGRNALLATSTFTRADGSIGSVGDAALAFRPGKPAASAASAIRQVAATLRSDPATAARAFDERLSGKLESLRAGLNSRPFLSLAADGDSAFERHDRAQDAVVKRETSLVQMDVPALQVPVKEEESAQAEAAAATAVAPADELRLARMVQDMASFGLRSGEGEWKGRHQASQTFDYFA
ncbi:MAG TPA: cadherin domain-containing protein [Allosphingosinicella sp.]|jgi:Ca2+-binding RTX toxin-like protein